jgi:hemerythrin superfamily protein
MAAAAQDGIALLREDHRAVKLLFKEFFATGDRAHATRRRIADRIITELSIHAGIEETVLYPRARAVVPKAEGDVLEALEEHHVAKLLCAELQGMNPKDERFAAKMTVLRESVVHHIEEEETDLFPKLRKVFSRDELRTMGEDMRAARRVVPTRPHPEAPDEPPGNIAASAVTRPIDTMVEAVGTVVDRTKRAVAGTGRG